MSTKKWFAVEEQDAVDVIDGFQILDPETGCCEDSLSGVEAQINPVYETDYLQAMIDQEEMAKNMIVQSSEEHEATIEALKTKVTAICRHKVQNHFWRPGKPLEVEVGQATFIGIAGPKEVKPLAANHQPKSFVGCLRAGMNKQQAREYLNACQKTI